MKPTALVLSVLSMLLASAVFAQTTTNMLGPITPARADTNGDGTVSPADANITPSRSGPTDLSVELANPWQVGINNNNTILLSNADESGRYQTFTRNSTSGIQTLTVTGFDGGTPALFSMQHNGGSLIYGAGQLLDGNENGIFDGIMGSGGSVSFNLNFVHIDTNADGFADYISIPWAQAELVGVNFDNTVGGINPQVWVPLADTNGDGRGDAIVPDFDGDGVPDPDLYASAPGAFGPVTVVASAGFDVPTLSEWAMLLTLLTLTAMALWKLRHNQNNTVGI